MTFKENISLDFTVKMVNGTKAFRGRGIPSALFPSYRAESAITLNKKMYKELAKKGAER